MWWVVIQVKMTTAFEDWSHMLVPSLLPGLSAHTAQLYDHLRELRIGMRDNLERGQTTEWDEQAAGLYKGTSFPWKNRQEMLFGVSHRWWRMEKCGMLCWRNFRAANECNGSMLEMKACKVEQQKERRKERKEAKSQQVWWKYAVSRKAEKVLMRSDITAPNCFHIEASWCRAASQRGYVWCPSAAGRRENTLPHVHRASDI